MRINEYGPRASAPPYNDLFEHFGEEIYLMCRERAFDAQTYIEMPDAEKQIQDFAKSGSTNVCVVVGAKGIGKTSVLNHLIHVVWPQEACAVIHLDLRGVSYSEQLSESLNNPDYLKKTAESLVEKELRKTINSWVQQTIASDPGKYTAESIVAEIKVFGRELIPIDYWLGSFPSSEIYKAIATQYPLELERLMFFILLRIGGYKHAKVIVDNLDDKDWRIVMGFSESLAHLREFIAIKSRLSNPPTADLSGVRLTPIIACRPITFWTLAQERPLHRSDWYGIQEVRIGRPSSLGKILRRRYDREIAGGKKKVSLVIKGKPITIDNKDKLFRRICTRIEESGQADLLLQLANYDMADAMTAALEVLRNRHFVRTDKLMTWLLANDPASQDLSQITQAVFSKTVVLRSLAYGNQASDAPVYPVAKTRVPNVLIDTKSHLGVGIGSLAKPLIISYLLAERRASNAMSTNVPLGRVVEFERTYLNTRNENAKGVIDELYVEGLVSHPQGIINPSLLPDCEIEVTPRLVCLWEELQSSSLLLQAYRESMELPIAFVPATDDKQSTQGNPYRWFDQPAYSTYGARGEVLMDLTMIIMAIRKVESELHDRLRERELLDNFQRLVGTELICHRLAQGLSASLEKFWGRQVGVNYPTLSRVQETLQWVLTTNV